MSGIIRVKRLYDIRTIQDFLGHKDQNSTMIYTHIMGKNKLGITTPLDKKRL
ncbi:MAG: tyrosine-type recombinase/integrase [Deltaproteobacteria bacterium]|nr:tyrosine-type recombinase/integrase [Deltaproteobacteria bacterium]